MWLLSSTSLFRHEVKGGATFRFHVAYLISLLLELRGYVKTACDLWSCSCRVCSKRCGGERVASLSEASSVYLWRSTLLCILV